MPLTVRWDPVRFDKMDTSINLRCRVARQHAPQTQLGVGFCRLLGLSVFLQIAFQPLPVTYAQLRADSISDMPYWPDWY